MDKCKHCGALIGSYSIDCKLEDIPGQEHVKRAIEVCLTGNHSITIIDCGGYGKEFGNWLKNRGISVRVETLCPCGNIQTIRKECHCDIEKITEWRNRPAFKTAMESDIIIESTEPRPSELTRKPSGEPELDMIGRVNAAQTIAVKDGLDDQSRQLLTMAIDKLGFNHRSVKQVKEVAKSVAKLDHKDQIGVIHISEAIQYKSDYTDK